MLRSLYTAATSMLVQRKKMDVITNNIANVETSGYKKDRLLSRSFKDMLISRLDDPAVLSYRIGPQNTGVHIDEILTDFASGSLENTGRLSDLALQGNGFFAISTTGGERYTRDGSFNVNSEGYLVTSDGNYVLGTNGRIHVGTGEFAVDESGNVTAGGANVGRLKIVSFAEPGGLRKVGGNLFINYTNQNVQQATDTAVKQGFLESSNVDVAGEMVEMMTVYRTYETNQRMVKMLDESLGKAVNEVGRV